MTRVPTLFRLRSWAKHSPQEEGFAAMARDPKSSTAKQDRSVTHAADAHKLSVPGRSMGEASKRY